MADGSRAHLLLGVIAAALGALALAAGDPYPTDREQQVPKVGAIELARWIRDGRARVHLIDIRPAGEFHAYHIPGAEHVTAAELARRAWPARDTVVLYGADPARAEGAALALRRRGVVGVRVVRGGLLAWIEQIAEPRLPPLPATATAGQQAARREHLDLSRHFGGMPVVLPGTGTPTPAGAAPVPARPSPSEAAAVARIIRRGC